jgi:hypothetical protein
MVSQTHQEQEEEKADRSETCRISDCPVFVGGLLRQPATSEYVARPNNCSSNLLTAAEERILHPYRVSGDHGISTDWKYDRILSCPETD